MAIFTAAAAIGASIVSAFTGTIAVASGFGFVATAAIGFAAQAAIGLALNALTPKPKAPSFSTSTSRQGYTVNQRGAALDHQVIYGRVRVGGAVVFDGTTGTNNKFLHRVIAVAGHEVDSFDEIYINDAKVTELESDGNVKTVELADGSSSNRYNGFLRINKHLGSPDQLADADLVSEVPDWTNEHRLRGVAYLYARFKFNSNKFPNGVPQITATVKGKKVYDPRTETTSWSDNPALCLRDYIISSYGLDEDVANVDDTQVISAANVCDETDTNAGTTRYTCNGAFTTDLTPYDLLSDMLTSMGGLLWYAQGKWRMKPAYWVEPTVTFNEDDLRSNISVQTRHSRRDNFNTVRGTFRGEETNWQITDYPEVTNSAFIAADGGQESVADIELPYTDNSIEARRIARIALERNRQQLTVQASFGLRGFQVQVGDVVNLTIDRFGWSSKAFEVASWTFGLVDNGDLQVQMTLREISESVFDEVDDGIVYERDNTTLLSPFDVPSPGLTVSDSVRIYNQKVTNIANLNITSGQAERLDSVEVQYKKSSEEDWIDAGSGNVGVFTIVDLETGVYDFRVRGINSFGVKGDYTFVFNEEINPFVGPPNDVTGFEYELSGGSVFFEWNALSDIDLSHYRIKLNTSTTGATWGNSSTVVDKISRPGTSTSLPARSGTFLIKAYDKEGNESVNATSVVIQPGELPPLGTELTATEDPTFAGTKTNVVLVSSAIEIDDTTASSPSGEYFFDIGGTGYLDTGSSRTTRVTGFVTFTRAFDGAGSLLWDDIPDNWDTWPDNWDTWTDETANFGDVSVRVFVSTTDDDPSGTPTWGAYQVANGSEIVGRAFRFKAVLSSENTDYTPNVTELSATVEY